LRQHLQRTGIACPRYIGNRHTKYCYTDCDWLIFVNAAVRQAKSDARSIGGDHHADTLFDQIRFGGSRRRRDVDASDGAGFGLTPRFAFAPTVCRLIADRKDLVASWLGLGLASSLASSLGLAPLLARLLWPSPLQLVVTDRLAGRGPLVLECSRLAISR
jgi:hypothetical protein